MAELSAIRPSRRAVAAVVAGLILLVGTTSVKAGELYMMPAEIPAGTRIDSLDAAGTAVAVSRDGTRIAVGYASGRIDFLERKGASLRAVRSTPGHRYSVQQLQFTSDDRFVVSSASLENEVHVWDPKSARIWQTLRLDLKLERAEYSLPYRKLHVATHPQGLVFAGAMHYLAAWKVPRSAHQVLQGVKEARLFVDFNEGYLQGIRVTKDGRYVTYFNSRQTKGWRGYDVVVSEVTVQGNGSVRLRERWRMALPERMLPPVEPVADQPPAGEGAVNISIPSARRDSLVDVFADSQRRRLVAIWQSGRIEVRRWAEETVDKVWQSSLPAVAFAGVDNELRMLVLSGYLPKSRRATEGPGGVEVWDLEHARPIAFAPSTTGVAAVAVAHETTAIADLIGTRVLVKLPTRSELRYKPPQKGIGVLAVTPDKKTLVSAGMTNTVTLWDAQTLERTADIRTPYERYFRVAIDPSSRFAALSGTEGAVVIDLASGKPVRAVEIRPSAALRFLADGKLALVTQKEARTIALPYTELVAETEAVLTTEDQKQLRELGEGARVVGKERRIAVVHDHRRGMFYEADAQSNAPLRDLGPHADTFVYVLEVADNHLVAADTYKRAFVWRIEPWTRLFEVRGHYSQIERASISPNYLFTAGMDGVIQVWSLRDGKLTRTLVP